jgi:hypothetical protein
MRWRGSRAERDAMMDLFGRRMNRLPRNPVLTAVLVMGSLGFYAPVWAGITWKQMNRALERPRRLSPVWHALGIAFPLIGSFRTAEHAKLVNASSAHAHARPIVSLGAATALSLLAWIVVSPLNVPLGVRIAESGMSPGRAGLIFFGVCIAIVSVLVAYFQFALNAAWRAAALEENARFYRMEVVALVVLVVFWCGRAIVLIV